MSNFYRIFFILLLSILTANISLAKPVKWRIAEVWSKDTPMFSDAVKSMIKQVELMTNGEFKIEIFSAQDHKNSLGVFDMVKDGEFEMGHSVSNWWIEKDVNTAFFSSVPMGMIANEKHAWFYHGGGMELMQKVYGKYGLLAFPGGNNGTEMGGWFNKEIKSIDDLQGLKVRVPGWGGEVYEAIGADVTMLPPAELYPALRDGKLDALEFVGPSLDHGMKFHELAKYYYTGWHSPGSEVQFLINQKAYEKLPGNFKQILQSAMKVAAYDMLPHANHLSAVNLDKILTDFPEIKIRSFPRSVFLEFHKAMEAKLNETAASGDDLTKEIIQSQRDYLRISRQWTRFSDQAYLNNSLK